MSASTFTATAAEPEQAVGRDKRIREAVIRLAGNSQDGIQAIGGFLARLAGRSEQEVMTFMTIPSTISGGPSIFQVRLGTGEVLSAGDEADMLVAFYQHSYEGHVHSLKKGGVVLYDADHVEPNPEWQTDYRHVGVAISSLTVEAIGGTAKDKGKNVFVLGLLARVFDLNLPRSEQLIRERFGGKSESVVNSALSAFHAGYSFSIGDLMETFAFADSQKRSRAAGGDERQRSAGLRVDRRRRPVRGRLSRSRPGPISWSCFAASCPNTAAASSSARTRSLPWPWRLGPSYGGRVAVTGSSGPGISLKTEAIGWGVMAEVPLVIIDVQRGGPSTGLPTNVEQSDLNIACFGGHGDSPRVVLAPASVEDCFYTAIEAVNLARKFSVPVILLTDQAIATRIEAFEEPDFAAICQDLAPDLTALSDSKPYDLSDSLGVPRHAAPGTRILSGKYPIVTGLEHDEMGHPTASPRLHSQMTAKRRRKLQSLAEGLPRATVYGPPEGHVLLVGWGSTQGPIREAVDRVRAAGDSVSALHVRYLNPLPNGLEEIFSGFHQILVVELNDEGLYGYGQLAAVLRARYCDARIQGVNKCDGLTFKVKEIVAVLQARLAASKASPRS